MCDEWEEQEWTLSADENQLIMACQRFLSTDVIPSVLSNNVNVNCCTKEHDTPLTFACQNELSYDIIESLVERGADVCHKNNLGQTPLHFACGRENNLRVVSLLLDKGADINSLDDDGHSALINASRVDDNFDVIDTLLQRGAHVNDQDFHSGDTPLLILCKSFEKNYLSIQSLLEKGANVNLKNYRGETPLLCAFYTYHDTYSEEYKRVYEKLIEGSENLECKTSNGFTPLINAYRFNYSSEIIETLIKKGANVNNVDHFGNNALLWAFKNGNIAIDRLEVLLQRGANVNVMNNTGESPILLASCIISGTELIELLLNRGADINCKNKEGCTPLHKAVCVSHNERIVEKLLERGANINCKNYFGKVPLISGVRILSVELVQILLDRGADINCKALLGDSILHLISRLIKNLDKVLEIQSSNDSRNVEIWDRFNSFDLSDASSESEAELSESELVEEDSIYDHNKEYFQVEEEDLMGRSRRNEEFLYILSMSKLFLERGLSCNLLNDNGETALHLACMVVPRNEYVFRTIHDYISILVEHGADVNCKDNLGETPAHKLIRAYCNSSEKFTISLLQMLLSQGASLDDVNNNRQTVFHIADSLSSLKCFKHLISLGGNFLLNCNLYQLLEIKAICLGYAFLRKMNISEDINRKIFLEYL